MNGKDVEGTDCGLAIPWLARKNCEKSQSPTQNSRVRSEIQTGRLSDKGRSNTA